MNYWLFKSEPDCFSFDDLVASPKSTTEWDGVRNYQARNFMRDQMQIGDKAIFYHSNCNPPHAIGTMHIVHEAYPDFTAWDPASDHPDPKSTPENPRWFMVDVQANAKFKNPVPLAEMKQFVELQGMQLLKPGNRLSVMPIEKQHYEFFCKLGGMS